MNGDGNAHSLLGPYLVDAVNPDERTAFEAHLAQCDDCQREIESLRDVIATMADAEATPPPARMRTRVLGEAEHTQQLPPLDAPVSRAPSAEPSRRRRTWPRVMGAAASIVAVAAVGVGVVLNTNSEPDPVALERDVMMVATASDAASMDLELGASHLVVSKRMEAVAAMGYGAPMPTKGMEYQLWLVMDDGSAHPGPTFMPNDDGNFMALMHTGFARVSG